MKKTIKNILGYLVAMMPFLVAAQTQTENHVVSKTYKVESQSSLNTNDPNQVTTTIQYFDGIGRVKQSVLVKGGKAGYGNNDLVYLKLDGIPAREFVIDFDRRSPIFAFVNKFESDFDFSLFTKLMTSGSDNR